MTVTEDRKHSCLVCFERAERQRPGLMVAGQAIAFLYDQKPEHMAILIQAVRNLNRMMPGPGLSPDPKQKADFTPA